MQYMWILIYGLILIVLAVFDIRTKSIPVWGLGAVFAVSVVCCVTGSGNGIDIPGIVLACVPGAFMIVLSFMTEGKIGMGDGVLILGIGIGLGLEKTAYLLMGALIAGCIFSGILLVFKKAGKNTRIPFVPFITFGLGVMAFAFK